MRLENLDLNLIVALEAIIRTRSVTTAASELNLTQPAVSRALSRLREHFCDQIVVPTGREMVPTTFGQSLFDVARRLLHETRTFAQMRPVFDASLAQREFTIVASDYVIRVFFTKVLPRLAIEAPNVSLRFVSIDVSSDTQFSRGEIDFYVGPDMIMGGEHPYEPLFRDDFVCVAWCGHPEIGVSIDRDTYLQQRHLTTAFGVNARDSHFEKFLKDEGITLKVAMSAPNFVLLPECIIGTPYLATIHARLVEQLPRELPLRVLPLPIHVPPITENLRWHRLRQHDKASIWMRNFMIDIARSELPPRNAVDGPIS